MCRSGKQDGASGYRVQESRMGPKAPPLATDVPAQLIDPDLLDFAPGE